MQRQTREASSASAKRRQNLPRCQTRCWVHEVNLEKMIKTERACKGKQGRQAVHQQRDGNICRGAKLDAVHEVPEVCRSTMTVQVIFELLASSDVLMRQQ